MEFQELVIIIFAIILSGFFYNTESKFEHPGSTYPPKTYLSSPTPQGQSRMGEGFKESSLSWGTRNTYTEKFIITPLTYPPYN